MKRYKHRTPRGDTFSHSKYREHEWKREHHAGGFKCAHCKQFVVINDIMGTANRNHCNMCLWSRHVDIAKGDRLAQCHGGMRPVGLTFKHEGMGRVGEVMVIHLCSLCGKISINRLARDDSNDEVMALFGLGLGMDNALRARCVKQDVYVLTAEDEGEVKSQLFGYSH